MIEQCDLSERRACRLAGLSRESYRHPPEADQVTKDLSGKIVEIAQARRRFGYRRIHDLLRPEFPGVNHKRVYRLHSEANLAVRRRKKRPAAQRVPLQLAQGLNEVWSMDFVSNSLANGCRIKCLTVADDFSHESVDIAVDWGISGLYVTRLLDRAALFRGYPLAVRTDNGPEFTCRAFMAWAHSHGVRHILIEPGRPMQNGNIESFNGKLSHLAKPRRPDRANPAFRMHFRSQFPKSSYIRPYIRPYIKQKTKKAHYLIDSRLSLLYLGWLMGLEPTTTGITILDSTN
jgi:putative transposase